MANIQYYSDSTPRESKTDDKEQYIVTAVENDIGEISSINESELDGEVFGHDRHKLKQSLKTHHIDIIAFVGVLGTGLFLSSGGALHTAGPLGIVMAYLIVGVVVGFNQMVVAEVSSLMPTSGASIRHLEHFVDEAWSFSIGWLVVYNSIMPGEISAAAVIITYWTTLSPGIWITIMIVLIMVTNLYSVRLYAETEVFFGILKLTLAVGLIILSIVLTAGGGPNHETIGFKYWKAPNGPFREYLTTGALGQFAGFWKVINTAVYSFAGTQTVPTLAAEVQNPRRSVFTACKRVFYRVTFIMCTLSLCLTLIIPSTNKLIANSTGNAKSSPFVVAIKNAGIPVLPHIINGVVLTSAFSAGNTYMMVGSRTLFALAVKKQAPKFFLKTTKRGVPWVGCLAIAIFMPLAYMSLSATTATVFGWFQSIVSSVTLVQWIVYSVNHIHLMRAMKAQGYTREQLPHTSRFAVFGSWFSLVASCLFLLTAGFPVFVKGHFEFSTLFSDYFAPILAVILWGFWKLFKKTKYLKPEDVNLKALFEDVENNPEPPIIKRKGWEKLMFWKQD